MTGFRKARPEEAHVVAPFIYGSARDLFDYTFPFQTPALIDFLAYDFQQGKGIFGSHWMTVATSQERVVGTLTIYPGRKFSALALSTFFSILRFYGLGKTIVILRRLITLGPLFKRPGRQSAYIANGFIAEDSRKHGVFSGLIEAAEAYCLENQLEAIECDISESNVASLKVHQFLGFDIQGKTAYQGKSKLVEGFIRMRLAVIPER